MTHGIDRRRWLQRITQSLAAWGAAGSLRAVDYDKPAPGSEKLTAEQTSGLMVFRWNNRTIRAYRAQSSIAKICPASLIAHHAYPRNRLSLADTVAAPVRKAAFETFRSAPILRSTKVRFARRNCNWEIVGDTAYHAFRT
jgi:hypothetical protein